MAIGFVATDLVRIAVERKRILASRIGDILRGGPILVQDGDLLVALDFFPGAGAVGEQLVVAHAEGEVAVVDPADEVVDADEPADHFAFGELLRGLLALLEGGVSFAGGHRHEVVGVVCEGDELGLDGGGVDLAADVEPEPAPTG